MIHGIRLVGQIPTPPQERTRLRGEDLADAVAGMVLCLRCGRSGAIYHIVGPRPVTFRELGETIATTLGVRPPRMSLPRWSAMLGALGFEALGRVSGWKTSAQPDGSGFL